MKYRFAKAIQEKLLAAAIGLVVGSASADNLIWNDGTANFVGSPLWSYNNAGAVATTSNPFSHNGGANTTYIGNGGDVTLNTVTNVSGFNNRIYGVRVGTLAGEANLTGIGGPDLRGSGTLRVSGATPLNVVLVSGPQADGEFIVGGADTITGTVIWDSTQTLSVDGAFRVGQNGTGVFTQNSGTVIGGVNPLAADSFVAIGSVGGTGTYNLNGGALQAGAALNAITGFEVRRAVRIGNAGSSTGTINLGNGVGAASSASITTYDEVFVGTGGGTGTLNIAADGRLDVRFATLANDFGQSGAEAPLVIGFGAGSVGKIRQQGGAVDTDGLLQVGVGAGTGEYEIVGAGGSINVKGLEVGAGGTLDFTFNSAGTTKITVEGSTNTTADTSRGVNLFSGAELQINSLNLYTSNSTVTLIDLLDSADELLGQFQAPMTQGALVGTNSLGTQFFLNYIGGTNNNDVVLQTTVPGSLTDGLVWNTGAANFTAGFARGNGSFGVAAFPVDPFGAGGTEDLYLGNNGVATLNSSGTADSLRIGTNQAGSRIAGRQGNGTLTATGSASLTLGNGAAQVGDTGNLTVGEGGFSGTLNWNSTGTLEAQGKFRVGQGGSGTVNQNNGSVIAGNTGGANKFLAVGSGVGSTGVYNLNAGTFLPGGGLIASPQLRQVRVGDAGATGTVNVGDGVGAAASARLESRDDLVVGQGGGSGTVVINADGALTLSGAGTGNGAQLIVGNGNGSVGTMTQNGGTVVADDLVQIGVGAGAVGSLTVSGGSFMSATDMTGSFQIARGGATGTVRVQGSATFSHGAELFVVNETNVNSVGRFEIAGSAASVSIGQLENSNGDNDETLRWEAGALGVSPLAITGAGPAANTSAMTRIQLQDPAEVLANTGSGPTLMGDGIALELNLSAYTASGALTLINNTTTDPITGFFENPLVDLDLYEQGAAIVGTGYSGTVNISYTGGTGNDVVLNLVAGPASDADFDNDGDVDGADFLTWQRGLGLSGGAATNAAGNANGDSVINGADLAVWRSQFGAPATPVAASVPEPGSFVLFLAAAAPGWLFLNRRRASRRNRGSIAQS